ncbi:limulus clotting factor C-like [Centruroides sculpturatus]|uniref:limulus clotting factor C-like n=1 Tax=Centruroides sculpturatus TaxID=218467 RepID=UPI000C6D497A|nr:limulus clotting factor C-like [Centruroides sculpturatus]
MDFINLIGIFIFHQFVQVSADSSIIDKCRDVVFTCNCGNPGYSFQAAFKQCHYWIPREEACTKFQHCLECDPGSNTCATCPPNRYGRYCTGTCSCKSGERCDKETGECICKSSSCGGVASVATTEDKFCPRIEILRGKTEYVISGTSGQTPVGSFPSNTIIRYSCNSFYELEGSSQRLCKSDGQWSGIDPRCKPECGISADKVPSIINGTKASLGEWPWQVALAYTGSAFIFCGGTLLSEKWIVTAAHCVTKSNTTSAQPNSAFKVFFGKLYRHTSGHTVQERDVERLIIHESFNAVTLDSDIALMEVKPLILTQFVRPVCLTTNGISQRNLEYERIGIVTGWGKDEKGKNSDILKVTNLTVISRRSCRESNNLEITENMFCAGTPGDRPTTDACTGDSGGPMVFPVQSEGRMRWYLEGIISWGASEGCATPNRFSGFTKVSQFIDWIHLYITEVTGWGKDEKGKNSDILKVTNLTVISRRSCRESNNLEITENMFCAGTPGDRPTTDACTGDSGGPMVFPVQSEGRMRWYLEGIISWGASEGCATPNRIKNCSIIFKGIFALNLLLKVFPQISQIGKCRKVIYTCNCGNPGYFIQAEFARCQYPISREHACSRFQFCSECDPVNRSCIICPPNRYGRLCTGTCNCKEGEKCNRDTGECICRSCNTSTEVSIFNEKVCPRDDSEFSHGRIQYTISSTTSFSKNGYPPNSIIHYSCNQFYKLHGVSQRLCMENGEWSGIRPRCKPECGISPKKVSLIINGENTKLGDWPWHVAITDRRFFIFCGGSLISEEWVLTAAHCLVESNSAHPQHRSYFKILFGRLHRNVNNNEAEERDVERLIIHPDYQWLTQDADIALIQVKPLTLTKYIRPVCLTTSAISDHNIQPGIKGVVSGWGRDETGRPSNVLKQTNLTVISNHICNLKNHIIITRNMFCAGVTDGERLRDTCRGDSGGPMVFQYETDGIIRWFLEGIVSWGTSTGCATPNKFSGFTKVSNFIVWINLYASL